VIHAKRFNSMARLERLTVVTTDGKFRSYPHVATAS
jgi:hypothetical protein